MDKSRFFLIHSYDRIRWVFVSHPEGSFKKRISRFAWTLPERLGCVERQARWAIFLCLSMEKISMKSIYAALELHFVGCLEGRQL